MTREQWAKLTPEEQRIKVAELCGTMLIIGGGPNKDVPDYLNDLNAIHEVENTCLLGLIIRYDEWVNTIVDDGYAWNATAAQKAEAVALTIEGGRR